MFEPEPVTRRREARPCAFGGLCGHERGGRESHVCVAFEPEPMTRRTGRRREIDEGASTRGRKNGEKGEARARAGARRREDEEGRRMDDLRAAFEPEPVTMRARRRKNKEA